MTGLPPDVGERIRGHLAAIADEFIPGTKLTLLARPPVGDDKDADCVVTNDDLPAAIEALRRRHREESA